MNNKEKIIVVIFLTLTLLGGLFITKITTKKNNQLKDSTQNEKVKN